MGFLNFKSWFDSTWGYNFNRTEVEWADTPVLGTGPKRGVGSTPTGPTTILSVGVMVTQRTLTPLIGVRPSGRQQTISFDGLSFLKPICLLTKTLIKNP